MIIALDLETVSGMFLRVLGLGFSVMMIALDLETVSGMFQVKLS